MDEIGFMKSFIRILMESQHGNDLVQTWMKQAVRLARDCDSNVEFYIHYVGSRPGDNIIHRTLRFLRTIHVRCSIARRIKQLNADAQEVRARRLAYGITGPALQDNRHEDPWVEEVGDEDRLRRCIILEYTFLDEEFTVSKISRLDILWYPASMLIQHYTTREKQCINEIFTEVFGYDEFAAKRLLHLIYINPQWRINHMQNYRDEILVWQQQNENIVKNLVMSHYRDELPTKYKTCLLYLTIFRRGDTIRATSLARRWVAEGLIRSSATTCATDEAERYLDVLATRGFIHPVEISAGGHVKRCKVYGEVDDVVTRIARDSSFVDTDLKPHLTRHLSIHNRVTLQGPRLNGHGIDIVHVLPTLAASPQWKLLKVLDLEGSSGLNKDLLMDICKILLLRYLSLRKTDVTELPKQIRKLRCLETLDIRQTQITVFPEKAIVLPRLKHFLAGHKVSRNNAENRFEESYSTVTMPLCVQKMEHMEILSNVKVSNSKELAGIDRLLKLKKFGVTLHGEEANLNDVFHQINGLHGSLCSLSIRVEQPAAGENHDAQIMEPVSGENHDAEIVGNGMDPLDFIKSLNINGLNHHLIDLIQLLPRLVKLTLNCTNVSTNDLFAIGNLCRLRSLRLQHKSYTEIQLFISPNKFQCLNFLLVEGNTVTSISFADGAGPQLERIIWSFATMEALSGINHLPQLRWLELNGNCSLESVITQINSHNKRPLLRHIANPQRQEAATATEASTSSAPSAPNHSPST